MYDAHTFKGDRIAFLGAGGGNDVFSCLLAAASLKRLGWEWKRASIGGILSPFHGHDIGWAAGYYRGTIRPDSTRSLKRRGEETRIPFVDAKVAELVEQARPYGIDHVFGLDASEGAYGLKWAMHHLGVERIVLVDVGGDIFAAWEDHRVLSPMFDAMALRAVCEPEAPPCTLFEAGPGTDGELAPERLRAELLRPEIAAHPLHAEDVGDWERMYKKWIEPTRPGNTVPNTIEAFRWRAPVYDVEVRARAQLGGRRWYRSFRQRIDTDLCKRFYLTAPQAVVGRNPFAVHGDPERWFRAVQSKYGQERNNEASLQYYLRHGRLLQFLTPSPLLDRRDRTEIITRALGEMEAHLCEEALLWAHDAAWVDGRWPGRFRSERKDGLCILTPNEPPR